MTNNLNEKADRDGDKDVSAIPAPYVDVTEEAPKTQSSTTTSDETDVQGKETSSPADTIGKGGHNKDDDEEEISEMRRRSSVVQALAKSYSRASGVAGGNPFFAGEDSPLNPSSDKFDGKLWAKAIVELVQQDGADFRSTGVCFQHMNVHGFGAGSDYQKDVANVWLSMGSMVQRVFGKGQQKIDILQNFDGLVRNGEMLVVLGPPGSGCSTFLKTIAGEMNGIYVDDKSYFNYQGKSSIRFNSSPVHLVWIGQRHSVSSPHASMGRVPDGSVSSRPHSLNADLMKSADTIPQVCLPRRCTLTTVVKRFTPPRWTSTFPC